MKTTHIVLGIALLAASSCGGGEPVPAAIQAAIDPARIWYHGDQDVMLTGIVTDATGMPIDDVEVRWTVEPSDGATQGAAQSNPRQARFTLGGPGSVVFTGCVVRSDETIEPTLCDSVEVRIDDGMPSLEVETPLPGAELDDPEGIVVRGSVADRSVVRVYVNGAAAPVDDMGRFETTVPAEFGIQHLVVDASDGLTEPSSVEMDVLWAQAYTAAMDTDGHPYVNLPEGLAIRLGQPFFDDGMPLDESATPVMTRDLADLIELVIGHLDVSGLVPDPVVDSPPTFTLHVGSVAIGAPHAEIALTDDGADLFIRIGEVTLDTSGFLMVDDTSLSLRGTVRASAVAYAHLTIRKTSEIAPLEVSVGDFSVGIESLSGTFESEETAAVFQLAEGIFRTTLESALTDAVGDLIETSVPGVLRDALGAIDTALQGQSFTLDSAPFPAVTVNLDGRIRQLSTVYHRDMIASLHTTVGTDVTGVHLDSRGVARLDTSATGSELYHAGIVTLGVRLSLLQGLLHALWNSGLLDVDVTPLLPDAVSGIVSEAHLVGRLPPVLRPPRADETDDLVLSVGQLELQLVSQGQPASFGVSIDAGVTVDLTENHIALGITEMPSIRVWTIVPAQDPRLLSPETVSTLLTSLWPMLSGSVASGLAFDLPLPALGDLGGLAPDLSGLTLSLSQTERMRTRGELLILDAELVGSLP